MEADELVRSLIDGNQSSLAFDIDNEGNGTRPPEGAYRDAMQRAGKLLARRARSEHEIRDCLSEAGFEDEIIERTLQRLGELGLVDDRAFALHWIDERSSRKGLGPEALLTELVAKGVDETVANEALIESGLDEESRAVEVAARLFRKVANRPLAAQPAALLQMLLRRGFSAEAAEMGVRAVMPPEGWD